MHRRQLLALSGSLLAGSAGCISASAPKSASTTTGVDDTTTDSPVNTETTTDSTTTTEYADVSVELDALQPALVTMTSPDSIGVSRRDEGQYLLLDISTQDDGRPPDRDAFSFEFSDTAHQPELVDKPWRIWRFHDANEEFYNADTRTGLLLFELPESAESAESSASGEDAAPVLTWPGGEWRPDEAVSHRLVTPTPPLSVSVEVSDEIRPSESPTISVTVRNEGDVPGRFVAGLNRSGPMVAFTPLEGRSMLVPAGESETWELTDHSIMSGGSRDEHVGDGQSDMTYHLDWSGGTVRRDVRYVE